MTGNPSPAGQVLGATTTGGAATALLANTGDFVFQSILVGVIIASATLIVVRVSRLSQS